VRAVAEAAGGPELAGAPYWADAAFIEAAGIPTVMYGASGAGAHAAVEWVGVPGTLAVTETMIAVAQRICG
jgi:acetylornithine deacetylase